MKVKQLTSLRRLHFDGAFGHSAEASDTGSGFPSVPLYSLDHWVSAMDMEYQEGTWTSWSIIKTVLLDQCHT